MRKFELYPIQYRFRSVRATHVAVALVETGADGGFAGMELLRDWKAVRNLNQDADVEVIESCLKVIQNKLVEGAHSEGLALLRGPVCGSLNVENPVTLYSDDPKAELRLLNSLYLEAGPVVSNRSEELTSAASAEEPSKQKRMKQFLADAGVRMKDVPPFQARQVTFDGDDLVFDCSYTKGNDLNLLHELRLGPKNRETMELVMRYPDIAADIQAKANLRSKFCAIVGEGWSADDGNATRLLKVMEKNEIVVRQISQMPEVANTVYRDLYLS